MLHHIEQAHVNMDIIHDLNINNLFHMFILKFLLNIQVMCVVLILDITCGLLITTYYLILLNIPHVQ